LDKQGNVDLIEGAYVPTPAGLPDSAKLGAEQAVQYAREQLTSNEPAENTPTSDGGKLVTITNFTGAASFQDVAAFGKPRRFYRALVR